MPVIFIILLFLILLMLFRGAGTKSRQRAKLLKIRGEWGKPKEETPYFERIEILHQMNAEERHGLSPQTKQDIDFYDLFAFTDRTASRVGQQYFYNELSHPLNDAVELLKRDALARIFAGDSAEREAVQLELTKLSDNAAYQIPLLMFGNLIPKPSWYRWVALDLAVTVLLIVLTPFYLPVVIGLLVALALNMAIHFTHKNKTGRLLDSFPQLDELINVSKKLLNKYGGNEKSRLTESIEQLRPFQSKRRLLNFGISSSAGDLEMLLYYGIELIKAFFLVDFFTFFSLIALLEKRQRHIRQLFSFIGSIDMAISIASVRAGQPQTCQPVFLPASKSLFAKEIIHPLVVGCVPNDVEVNDKSVLITGSNMSGKTTFLRTLAVNAILAQTIYTCFAKSYAAPLLQLSSSIRIDDDLQEGKSFYLAEVQVVNELIKASGSGYQNLFVLDEVFKGTNTVERIAAAKAVLSYLNKGDNLVFVATHDIELSQLLQSEYDLYHFVETISNGELNFDHLLKRGPLQTRNAINILEMSGFPKEITDEARKMTLINR